MGFDIRLPMGIMFGTFGLLLAAYGGATRGSDIYARHSLGINVNLWWGMAMLAFGLVMLLLVRRGSRLQAKNRLGTPRKS
jgi:tellurite resistance protein TehA-like permease